MARVATGTAPPDLAPTALHRAGAHEVPLRAPWAKPAGRGAVTSRQLRPFHAWRKMVRWIRQPVPFHLSARVDDGLDRLAAREPTAVQARPDVHETAES